MEVVKGQVTALRESTVVSGRQNGVNSETVTTFRVANKSVQMKTSSSVPISVGDEVAMAGISLGGIFRPYVWHNLSTGAHGAKVSLPMQIVTMTMATSLLLAGLAMAVSAQSFWLLGLGVFFVTLSGGSWLLRKRAIATLLPMLRTP